MKITHKKALEKIIKKVESLKVKQSTIKAYNNELNKIINSNYKVVERLRNINNNITPETKTLTDVRKRITKNNQEAKQETLAKKHLPTLNALKAFNQNKNEFIKVLATLDKIPKKNISIKDLPITFKKKNVLEIRIEKQHTRKQIQAFGDKISKLLKQSGVKGSISIALPFDIGPRSGYFTEFGDDIELFDPNMYYDGLHINKQDTFKSFNFHD